MPVNFRSNSLRSPATRTPVAVSPITALAAGTMFNLLNSGKGNYGPCIRVKDSKVGKGRFVELTNGKLLTTSAGDRIEAIRPGTELVVT